MITFQQFFCEENMAGGAGSVFGAGTEGAIGSFGNQYPSQNDKAYAPGDSRMLSPAGPIGAVLGAKKMKGKKNKKRVKLRIQRRPLPGLSL